MCSHLPLDVFPSLPIKWLGHFSAPQHNSCTGRCSNTHPCPVPHSLGHLLTAWENTQALLCLQTETGPGSPVAWMFFLAMVKRREQSLAHSGSSHCLQVCEINCSLPAALKAGTTLTLCFWSVLPPLGCVHAGLRCCSACWRVLNFIPRHLSLPTHSVCSQAWCVHASVKIWILLFSKWGERQPKYLKNFNSNIESDYSC